MTDTQSVLTGKIDIHALGVIGSTHAQLRIWGIDPAQATDEDVSAAFNVVWVLPKEHGGWA